MCVGASVANLPKHSVSMWKHMSLRWGRHCVDESMLARAVCVSLCTCITTVTRTQSHHVDAIRLRSAPPMDVATTPLSSFVVDPPPRVAPHPPPPLTESAIENAMYEVATDAPPQAAQRVGGTCSLAALVRVLHLFQVVR